MSLEEVKQCYVCDAEIFVTLHTFDYSSYGIKKTFILKRCMSCGLVLNSPRLTPENGAAIYEKDYYVFKEETEKMYSEEAKRDLQRILKVSEPCARLLEIGCARGHLLKLAQQLGYDVQGVEISTYAAEVARASGITVFNGTIEQASFPESSFDIIVILDVIEHVHDPLKFLETVCSYLRNEGTLILETPNVASLFARIGGKHWNGFNPYHINLFTPKTLTRLCTRAGLNVLKMDTDEANLLSFDVFRRIGLGRLLSVNLRSRIGSWYRWKKFNNKGLEGFSTIDIKIQEERKGIVTSWLNALQLGGQLSLYARKA